MPQKKHTPNEPTPSEPVKEPKADLPRGRQSNQPTCPYHGQRCKAGSSSPWFTRYYCPVEGCSYSEKVQRPALSAQLGEEEDFSAR